MKHIPKQMSKTKHIDFLIESKTHTPMYKMHKYWARKPFNVVRQYIETYSKKDDIILDPFCGSGVTVLEALKCGRRAIGIDLNPLATFITKVTAMPIDLKKFTSFFYEIEEKTKDRIYKLYNIDCPKCKRKAITVSVTWSYVIVCPSCKAKIVMADAQRPKASRQNIYICYHCKKTFSYANQEIIDEKPLELKYVCLACHSKGSISNPSLTDDTDLTRYWYPKLVLNYVPGKPFLTKRRAGTTEQLFTKRNIAALSMLLEAIEQIPENVYRDVMKLTFSGTIPQATRMMIWTDTSGPSWKMPEYIVYAKHQELNVWDRFENRYKAVLRGKTESNLEIRKFNEGKTFKDLETGANCLLITKSALDLTAPPYGLPQNSIDYIFTDPPYGGDIQYFELDFMRAAWLRGDNRDQRFNLDWWQDEITINESAQGKDFSYYHKMMSAAFNQIFKILKTNAYLTVTFHNTDVKTYTSILNVAILAGFKTERVVYQPPSVISVKAQAQPYGSAIGDYYIRFRKPSGTMSIAIPQQQAERYKRAVIENAIQIIAERGEPTPLSILLLMYPKLQEQGVLLGAGQGIDEVLREHLDHEFIIRNNAWWLKDPGKYRIPTIPLNERIERVVIDTLHNQIKVSFNDMVKAVYTEYFNSLTPAQSIKEVIEEYAERTVDKKWRLKSSVKVNISEHEKMIMILACLGTMYGFNVHIGRNEQSKTYDQKKLRDLVSRGLPRMTGKEKDVDVLWFSGDQIHFAFEIEYTTGITEAVVRSGSMAPVKIQRVFVIPKAKANRLYKKMVNPVLKDRIKEQNWKLIFFGSLNDYYLIHGEKRRATLKDFLKLIVDLEECQKLNEDKTEISLFPDT